MTNISKFTKLRPRHCVLAGSSGPHNVCICVHHKNVKLWLNKINIQQLKEDTDMMLKNYHVCLDTIVCPDSSSSCHLGEYGNCPNTANLKDNMAKAFDEHSIDKVTLEILLQTYICTLKTLVMDTDKFLDDFCGRLLKLKNHHFISKEKLSFFKNLMENSLFGEFLIWFDFAENYVFIIKNPTQSFHWNNDQATVFTVMIYLKKDEELKHISIAIISDNLAHDTVTVQEYQMIKVDYLKTHFRLKKIYYFTDGAGQYFKNKSSFANL